MSAIVDMVTPVVLITMAVILASGLLNAGTAVRDRVFELNREHLGPGEPGPCFGRFQAHHGPSLLLGGF